MHGEEIQQSLELLLVMTVLSGMKKQQYTETLQYHQQQVLKIRGGNSTPLGGEADAYYTR